MQADKSDPAHALAAQLMGTRQEQERIQAAAHEPQPGSGEHHAAAERNYKAKKNSLQQALERRARLLHELHEAEGQVKTLAQEVLLAQKKGCCRAPSIHSGSPVG